MNRQKAEQFLQRLARSHAAEQTRLALESLQSDLPPAHPRPPKHTVWTLPCPVCGHPLDIAVELGQSRYSDRYRVPECSWCDCSARDKSRPPEVGSPLRRGTSEAFSVSY